MANEEKDVDLNNEEETEVEELETPEEAELHTAGHVEGWQEVRDRAKPVTVTINDVPMVVPIKEFSTGSVGWFLTEDKGALLYDPPERLIFRQTCSSCHTLSAANARGVYGPNLDVRLGGRTADPKATALRRRPRARRNRHWTRRRFARPVSCAARWFRPP